MPQPINWTHKKRRRRFQDLIFEIEPFGLFLRSIY